MPMDRLYATFKASHSAAVEITHSLIQAGLLGSPETHGGVENFVKHLLETNKAIEEALKSKA